MRADSYDSMTESRIDSPLASSTAPLQPGIHDAVNNAMHSSSNQVDPALIASITARITEEVLEALKAKGVSAGAAQASTQLPTPAASQTLSDPDRTATSITPQQASRQPPLPPQQSSYADRTHVPLQHPQPTTARPPDLTSPVKTTSSQFPARYTPPSPGHSDALSEGDGSSSPEPHMYGAGRRDSRSSQSGQEDGPRQRPRPVRIPSAIEETSIEKAWKPLFEGGKPTARLGQFLRGLALHIIEDCKPRSSIVVTPGKLSDFFAATKMPIEMYPWREVFGGSLTNNAISSIFLQLNLQHHLVQLRSSEPPTIPGLTPKGFEAFMIMVISAFPDQEFERFNKAVQDMPISNSDCPAERFPKELSRRLFPISGDYKHQQKLNAALSSVNMPARSIGNVPPPPPPAASQSQPSSIPSSQASYNERERTSAIDDDDLRGAPSFVPIERERKPYTAREGSGKMYEDTRGPPGASRTRSGRSNSALPQDVRSIDVPSSTSRSNRHSMNIGARPDMRYGNNSGAASTNPYTRSEGTNVSEIPSSYYASNMDYDEPPRDPRRTLRRQPTEDEVQRGYARSTYEQGGQHVATQRPHANSDSYGTSFPPPPPRY